MTLTYKIPGDRICLSNCHCTEEYGIMGPDGQILWVSEQTPWDPMDQVPLSDEEELEINGELESLSDLTPEEKEVERRRRRQERRRARRAEARGESVSPVEPTPLAPEDLPIVRDELAEAEAEAEAEADARWAELQRLISGEGIEAYPPGTYMRDRIKHLEASYRELEKSTGPDDEEALMMMRAEIRRMKSWLQVIEDEESGFEPSGHFDWHQFLSREEHADFAVVPAYSGEEDVEFYRYREVIESLSRFFSPSVQVLPLRIGIADPEDRAHYVHDLRRASMPRSGSLTSMAHEFGHHLERYSGGFLSASQRWLYDRAKGDPVPLRSLVKGSGYGDREVAFADVSPIAPYVGKYYPEVGEGPRGTLRASEITSMALQEFFYDPEGFYETDPELFEHLFYLMQGVTTHKVEVRR